MKKNLIAVLMVAVMLFAFAGVANAADQDAATNRLMSLGIVQGDPNGDLRLGDNITRAEFAKVAIIAAGLEDAADLLKNTPSQFSDVKTGVWYTGWINLAADQGLVKGDPAGTFRPSDNISYAEAVTVLLRILGYNDNLPGSWPTDYIVKAVTLGITNGVSFDAKAPATRGDVFVMSDASLGENVATYDKDTNEFNAKLSGGNEISLMADKLNVTSEEGFLVQSPELFAAAEDKIKIGTNEAVEILDVASYKGLLGHEVKAWKNSDGKVFLIEDLTAADSVKVADYKDVNTVVIDDEDVDITGAADVFKNYAASGTIADGDEITVIYDGDDVNYVVALGYTTKIVDSVNETYEKIYFTAGSLSLKDYDNVAFSGDAAELADIEEGDVVQYITDGSENAIVIVTRNVVTGTFTKKTSTKITVGGVEYKYTTDATLLGEEVELTLDKDGKVVAMAQVSEEEAQEVVAVVLGKDDSESFDVTTYKVKVFTQDGVTVVYSLASDAKIDDVDVDDVSFDTIVANNVIEYTLNDDGDIDKVTTKVVFDAATAAALDADVDDDNNLVDGAVMTTSTIYFDYTDLSDIEVATQADVEGYSVLDGYVIAKDGKATIVVITGGTAASDASDVAYGMLTGEYQNADKDYVVSILGDGDYVNGDASAVTVPAVVKYTVDGSDIASLEAATAVALTADTNEFRVTAVDTANNLITVKEYNADGDLVATSYYVVNADTLYFDTTGDDPVAISLADVNGQVVDLYVESGIAKAIVVIE